LADDLPDVILETLVEHTIGLVENKVGDTRKQKHKAISLVSGLLIFLY
jgi:hypothetical protein